MSKVRVLVIYDGEWINFSYDYIYSRGKTKGIIVSEKITYQELVDRVYGIVKVDPNEYGIIMKAHYKANMPTKPVEIVDDDDVRFFICETVALPTDSRSPLCITLERRGSENQQTQFVSRSESNQLSGIVPAVEATEFEASPLFTEVDKQDPMTMTDNPMYDNVATQANSDCGDGLLADDLGVGVHCDVDQCDNVLLRDGCTDPFLSQHADNAYLVDHSNSHEEISCGQKIASKKELRKKLKSTAVMNNFMFKVKKSTKDRFEVGCVDENCKWRLRATKVRESEFFEIRRYHNVHSCKPDEMPKKKRVVSAQVQQIIRKCGRCGETGHNKQTCKNINAV